MRTRRPVATLVVALAALSLAVGTAADTRVPHRPEISFDADVPEDLRALAEDTWRQFLAAFPSRWDCVADVTVTGAWELPDRAGYDPERRLVTVRIPGTAQNLGASMVHEFAHHLEFTCRAQRALRPRFLRAEGLSPVTPWFGSPNREWEDIPSEHFAQATVRVVTGRPSLPLIPIRPAALAAIRAWGRGR